MSLVWRLNWGWGLKLVAVVGVVVVVVVVGFKENKCALFSLKSSVLWTISEALEVEES